MNSRGGGRGDRGGRGGRGGGRGRGGRGGGGMKGGSRVVVEPHRHEGVFIAKGKEDALVTKNMVPGEAVYNEKRISVQVFIFSILSFFFSLCVLMKTCFVFSQKAYKFLCIFFLGLKPFKWYAYPLVVSVEAKGNMGFGCLNLVASQ